MILDNYYDEDTEMDLGYVGAFLEEADEISQYDLGYVAEAVNVQCFDEDTFVVESEDLHKFMNYNDIESYEEALAYVAEANGIDYMPVLAIKEADIVDDINYADMGDSSLLEAYDNMIAQCLEEDVDLCMIALDERFEDLDASMMDRINKIKDPAKRARIMKSYFDQEPVQSIRTRATTPVATNIGGKASLSRNQKIAAGVAGAGLVAAGAYAGKKMYDKCKAKKAAAAAAAAEQERLANRSRFEVARDTAKAKIAQMRNR